MTNTEVNKRKVIAAVRPGFDGEVDFWLSPGLKAAIKNASPPRVDVAALIKGKNK